MKKLIAFCLILIVVLILGMRISYKQAIVDCSLGQEYILNNKVYKCVESLDQEFELEGTPLMGRAIVS